MDKTNLKSSKPHYPHLLILEMSKQTWVANNPPTLYHQSINHSSLLKSYKRGERRKRVLKRRIIIPNILPKLDSSPNVYHKSYFGLASSSSSSYHPPHANIIFLRPNLRAPSSQLFPKLSYYDLSPKNVFLRNKSPTLFSE